jgi:hypothetical protein
VIFPVIKNGSNYSVVCNKHAFIALDVYMNAMPNKKKYKRKNSVNVNIIKCSLHFFKKKKSTKM